MPGGYLAARSSPLSWPSSTVESIAGRAPASPVDNTEYITVYESGIVKTEAETPRSVCWNRSK